MTYWMCDKCSFVIEAPKPPDPCPSCHRKCVFSDVTCYQPECGGMGGIDSRLVAERVVKREKPGKVMRFTDFIKGPRSEGKEKHIPTIELMKGQGKRGADLLEIIVGREAPHPNTADHYIMWIQAFGVKKDGHILDLGRANFKPGIGKPSFSLDIDASEFDHLFTFSYCNVHGVWEQHLEV